MRVRSVNRSDEILVKCIFGMCFEFALFANVSAEISFQLFDSCQDHFSGSFLL